MVQGQGNKRNRISYLASRGTRLLDAWFEDEEGDEVDREEE